ncbi:MAG: GNAT family N-acetyltransferase [Rhodobacterales bacterium 65-51]|uniref:GNAT family N-acetyltransferase n=1 Tax=uncultured Gemmobacter sp. TaxID=1095917 RepID=UPI000961A2F2|nr:GNAT family N-acetyltransferase [uncultured Gemmobacter sp.]OJY36304.1 MAG: GNAT family N-acetyltransferase [Rhodobacterales bacterium 65-51]
MSDLTVTLAESIAAVPAADWDALAAPGTGRPDDPFTTHRFLLALEASGSTGPGTGWLARPLLVHRGAQMIAAAPLYVKSHSQGEYIFDHGWAEAYERAGGRYYPKLQIAVPFTPATGRRFLTLPGEEVAGMAALIEGATRVAQQNGLSSLHATFCTEAEAETGAAMGLMPRLTQQFHWQNDGYSSYEDFLATLASRKRKALRKERAMANSHGLRIENLTGDALRPEHWDAFWAFYQDTGSRKWGRPYLTRNFFDRIQQTMRDDVLLVLAFDGSRPVAGALNFIGRSALYGRYWGCVEDYPCLHFELCYHRAIDWAIAQGLDRVEAGAQGEHKLARGYLPAETHSLHWIADPAFARAVADYLDRERAAVDEEIEVLTAYGPFRRGPAQDD